MYEEHRPKSRHGGIQWSFTYRISQPLDDAGVGRSLC